jgi:low affinity Fe/Cu permease
MINKNIKNNNMTIVRNISYKQIEKINKKLKEVIEVDNTLLDMIDINMKNAINKIINNYKVYQETGVLKVK